MIKWGGKQWGWCGGWSNDGAPDGRKIESVWAKEVIDC